MAPQNATVPLYCKHTEKINQPHSHSERLNVIVQKSESFELKLCVFNALLSTREGAVRSHFDTYTDVCVVVRLGIYVVTF